MASQEEYVKNIPAIDVGKSRQATPDAPINDVELTSSGGIIGSLQ